MSSSPNPLAGPNVPSSPFVQTTTPAIERANRLLSLRAHPGFRDLLRIFQELTEKAVQNCSGYPGWDPQVIVVLKVRQQCAMEHAQAVLSEIEAQIQAGVAEGIEKAADLPVKNAGEILDQGDYVRQAMLQRFADEDNRPAGSH